MNAYDVARKKLDVAEKNGEAFILIKEAKLTRFTPEGVDYVVEASGQNTVPDMIQRFNTTRNVHRGAST